MLQYCLRIKSSKLYVLKVPKYFETKPRWKRKKKYHNSLFWNSPRSPGTYFPYYHLRPLNQTSWNPPPNCFPYSPFFWLNFAIQKGFLLSFFRMLTSIFKSSLNFESAYNLTILLYKENKNVFFSTILWGIIYILFLLYLQVCSTTWQNWYYIHREHFYAVWVKSVQYYPVFSLPSNRWIWKWIILPAEYEWYPKIVQDNPFKC